MDKEIREKLYHKYLEIGFQEVLYWISGAYSLNKKTSETEKLKNLLPISFVWGAYDNRPFEFECSITGKKYIEEWNDNNIERGEEKRRIAIDIINKRITQHNRMCDDYNSTTAFEKRDIKKYRKENYYDKWLLNVRKSRETLNSESVNKTLYQRKNISGLSKINNKYLYKKALRAKNSEDYCILVNKMIYDYLQIITPRRITPDHIFHNAILEFENWFMIKGLSIEQTPNFFDVQDGIKVDTPLALALEEEKEKNKIVNYEYSNLIKITRKRDEKKDKMITALISKGPEQRFNDMVRENKLDEWIRDNKLIHKSSGWTNWKGLAESIGLRDGRTVKNYAKKYAPYLLKEDEQRYTI